MPIVKALKRLSGGFYGQVAATDQIACDAGAMTVTPTGGSAVSVPDAFSMKRSGAGTVARSMRDRSLDLPHLLDWSGVDLTGNNASTSAMQAAVTAAGTEGFVLNMPAGKITLDAPITTGVGLSISGMTPTVGPIVNGVATPGGGTWVHLVVEP